MFETYRGTEYGWGLVSSSVEDSIHRSNILQIIEGITRADVDESWKTEARALLREIHPGVSLGTPMDHAARTLLRWRKFMALYRSVMKRIFVLGSHSQATILNRPKSKLSYGKDLIWHPKFQYNTYIMSVIENRAGQAKMDELLNILKEATGGSDFESADAEIKASIVEALAKAQGNGKALYIASPFAWLPRTQEPEQLEASEYTKVCHSYQNSIAGKRAKRLLLENLTEAQESDYFRHGYFFVVPYNQDCSLHERRIYVIERGFPNGNVLRVKQNKSISGQWHWYPKVTYCFHTKEPHAIDDILLGQKLMLEHEESDFLQAANESKPEFDGRAPLARVRRSV